MKQHIDTHEEYSDDFKVLAACFGSNYYTSGTRENGCTPVEEHTLSPALTQK